MFHSRHLCGKLRKQRRKIQFYPITNSTINMEQLTFEFPFIFDTKNVGDFPHISGKPLQREIHVLLTMLTEFGRRVVVVVERSIEEVLPHLNRIRATCSPLRRRCRHLRQFVEMMENNIFSREDDHHVFPPKKKAATKETRNKPKKMAKNQNKQKKTNKHRNQN